MTKKPMIESDPVADWVGEEPSQPYDAQGAAGRIIAAAGAAQQDAGTDITAHPPVADSDEPALEWCPDCCREEDQEPGMGTWILATTFEDYVHDPNMAAPYAQVMVTHLACGHTLSEEI